MGLLICPRCKTQTGVPDKDTTVSPDCHDFRLTFKCKSCKDVFVAIYNLKEFWQLSKGVVHNYYATQTELIKKDAEITAKKEEMVQHQLKLF